ncbi:MAG: glycosyltransferase family 1 protein [Gemmatimonadetes bacterium]|nr:glycosyltransferase family 1 protein [Gemmatimonadota bacterium]
MRIAYFSEVYWPKLSGVSCTLMRTVDGLGTMGHQTRVYTPQLPGDFEDRPEVHRSPGRPLAIDRSISWGFPRRADVLSDLRGFAPDIIHVATEFPMGRVGSWAARRLGVPLIASAHTDYEKYSSLYRLGLVMKPGWAYLRRFYGRAGRVLCPSRPYEAHLNRRGVTHTGIWSRGVDTHRFHPRFRSDEYRARFGAGPDDTLVTYVGRLAPEKDLDVLLRAWAGLGASRFGAKLVFVGDGLMENEIRAHELPDAHMTGPLEGQELATAYASADVLLFPSSTETFGNCLLEGMASGLACVAVGAGGVTDFARHEENSLLAEPRDAGAYGRAVARVLADRGLRRRLSLGARTAAGRRSWTNVFDRLLDDYREVAEVPVFDHAA